MQVGGITRNGIKAAIKEHDNVGRELFLTTYRFRPATRYVLVYQGRRYDPKAIAAVAHQHDFGRALTWEELSSGSGSSHAFSWLRREGFQVLSFERDLIRRVGNVRPAEREDGTSRHRPLLLLHAISQATANATRLQSWSEIRDALSPLLVKYAGAADGADAAQYPFWALTSSELWEVIAADDLVMTSQARRPTLKSLNAVDPRAGFLEQDYKIFRGKPEVAAEAAAGLLLRFFHDTAAGLIADLGLSTLLEGRWGDALRPLQGEQFKNRDTIWHTYGGQKMGGIGYLNDGILSAFADDKGPYADSRLPDTGWIAYVGDGLKGDQEIEKGNQYMATYQDAGRPLRYWHKPFELDFAFETWAVIVQCRKQWGEGGDGAMRREFVWVLAPVPSPDPSTWPADTVEAVKTGKGKLYDETTDYLPEDIKPAKAAAIVSPLMV